MRPQISNRRDKEIGEVDVSHTAVSSSSSCAGRPARIKPSNYPEPFASLMAGRVKHPLGDLFGLRTFGVNWTVLAPGSVSSLHHRHSRQDELVYVIAGRPTLFLEEDRFELEPGMVVGFPADGTSHHLVNESAEECVLLEVGDRTEGDEVTYPNDDLRAEKIAGGGWRFLHKDGRPYG